jgi:hypothetical protein
MKKTSKMGRPKMAKGTANSVLFAFRLPANDAKTIQAAVKASGMTMAEWARRKLLEVAR